MIELSTGFRHARHDCEMHYAKTEHDPVRSRFNCSICGGTAYLTDEQWQEMQARTAAKRAKIEALRLTS